MKDRKRDGSWWKPMKHGTDGQQLVWERRRRQVWGHFNFLSRANFPNLSVEWSGLRAVSSIYVRPGWLLWLNRWLYGCLVRQDVPTRLITTGQGTPPTLEKACRFDFRREFKSTVRLRLYIGRLNWANTWLTDWGNDLPSVCVCIWED